MVVECIILREAQIKGNKQKIHRLGKVMSYITYVKKKKKIKRQLSQRKTNKIPPETDK